MSKLRLVSFRVLFVAFIVLVAGIPSGNAQATRGSLSAKIVLGQKIDETQKVSLPGHVRPDLTPQRDMGVTEDAKQLQLSLLLARSPEQQADLDALLAQTATSKPDAAALGLRNK